MQELPYTISIPSFKTTVVHAGLVPNVPLEQQSFADMVTMRNVLKTESPAESPSFSFSDNGTSDSWEGSSKGNAGESWAKIWSDHCERGNSLQHHVYFGHDAKRGLQQYKYATGLDTGCCYGKPLASYVTYENI